ncbi:IMV surface protein [Murmansk poxvirus]|uniref:IMV surface protein n=1 Tax=Murmansk poxvirus TaxID=2025359 RepID=A0A223FMX7_9POXV|nr:IMV surface protein [Murmansk poxvirus]AST09338.1 IMV surface protein [Murmansk poxvirus]
MEEALFPGDDDMPIPAKEFFNLRADDKNKKNDDSIPAKEFTNLADDPPQPPQNTKERLKNIETKLNNITAKFSQIEKCCKKNDEIIYRLENHAETLRVAMLALAKKIDIQTGRQPYEPK